MGVGEVIPYDGGSPRSLESAYNVHNKNMIFFLYTLPITISFS